MQKKGFIVERGMVRWLAKLSYASRSPNPLCFQILCLLPQRGFELAVEDNGERTKGCEQKVFASCTPY